MTPERWQKIRELFHGAIERNPQERAAYLGAACAMDPSLLPEVEQLISLNEQADGFLEPTQTTLPTAEGQLILEPGQQVGHYRIIEAIGRGGMGVVYKAEDTKLGRSVALKFLPPIVAGDAQALERFRREARAASALNHPNVCTIHAIEEDEGRPFIVMELLQGRTLAECIGGRPLERNRLVEISVQIADALQAAHEQGITHRDIKPGNIFVTDRGQVKILDFGLARIMSTPDAAEVGSDLSSTAHASPLPLTRPGGIVGTLPYLSPEQLRGEQPDSRSDLFSFGTVLYEMATGKPAFSGTQETAVDAILTREPASPRSLNAQVPSELEQIVARALKKRRELRYQSAAELKADLLRIDERSSPSSVSSDSGPILRGFRRKASILTLGIILAGMLAAVLWRARERPPLAKGGNPPAVRSLAVLPLENQTGDAGQEFYVDGMTDALITRLAQVSALQVTSKQSVLRYKTEKKPLPTIARELGVSTVVTGSVARSGNQVHIDAQLVDAASGRRLWSRSYDRDLSEVSVLQSEIAGSIAEEIKAKMTPLEQARLAKARAVNPAAYEAYLQGRFLVSRHSVEEATKSLKYFQQAIDIDPDYAPAYAGLCESYENISQFSGPKREAWEKGKAAANRALELDETLAEAHRCRARGLLLREWDWVESEKEYQRALQLNPGDPDTYGAYGVTLTRMGRTNEGIAVSKRALELDPLSAQSAVTVAASYYNGRQYDRALEQARRAVELDPTFIQGHRWLGLGYAAKGKFPEAIDEFKLTVKLSPGNLSYLTNLARLYAWAGKETEARQTLAQVRELSKSQFIGAWTIGLIYVALGDKDEAFAWMDRAYEEREGWLLTLRVNPWLDPLRSDPRFDELVRRVEATAKLTPISKDESQIQH